MLVPFIAIFFMALLKIRWFFYPIGLVLTPIIIGLFQHAGEKSLVNDTEYWTGYIQTAEKYEAWDEMVSCRHPKYKTVTTIRNGKAETTQVQDGYHHLYDVDYHPEHYQCIDNNQIIFNIDSHKFEQLAQKFGNKGFVNLHRHFHTINGNKYETKFPNNKYDLMEVCCHTHTYENRIVASNSILKYPKVEEITKKQYGLFDYPEVTGYYDCPSLLGLNDSVGSRRLDILNAKYGRFKQIRVWIVVFHDQPLDAGFQQMNYWQGGNKNELVVCIGLQEEKVQWGHVFSWTEVESIKTNTKQLIEDQEDKPLDIVKIIDKMDSLIYYEWQRRNFKDFEYLSVETPGWSILWSFIVVLFVNGLLIFGLYKMEQS